MGGWLARRWMGDETLKRQVDRACHAIRECLAHPHRTSHSEVQPRPTATRHQEKSHIFITEDSM